MERIPFLGPALARLALDPDAVDPGPLEPATARLIVARLNATRDPTARQPLPGELLALSLLHEAAHLAIVAAVERQPEAAIGNALPAVRGVLGPRPTSQLLTTFAKRFPGLEPEAAARLEDLLLIHLANDNPAARPLRELVDETALPEDHLRAAIDALERHLASLTVDGDGRDGGATLVDLLREPARAAPDSLIGQLRYVREHWGWLLGGALDELLGRLDVAIGVLTEEQHGLHARFGGGGAGGGVGEAPSFEAAAVEPERFSQDRDWMPELVLLAKSTYVWLDQLSMQHGREIRTLDAIPDEELATIARRGITGLWLIGLWQRSKASETIKRWRGNEDAVASAYSLDDYRISDDLGGEEALKVLRDQAWRHGIRLASDMVPNHMGIDSRWVIEHPERFIGLDRPPYPSYRFEGANLSTDPRVEIRIEDHYWDDSDAAVVFERRDAQSGRRRYVYHGNDGTSFPWNDTAQLDYLQAEVREVVIATILDVARRFPVIRFDAAMVLAKKHVERLWYPEPGEAGGIPSRAEHGTMTKRRFDRLMPQEFWREVVDRVAAEAPDTLLLAEAFWLLEGYFVRTLGMHRVYNSAFMHMVRDENNAGYRKVIRDTIEFEPAILGRYVNFLTNPDEETAIEQFGTGDRYFGAATLLATLPGLPMIGHGQVEGFVEKYGMEFQRARLDERPNLGLIDHFEAQIVPLLRERRRFAGATDFRLYDVRGEDGQLNEDVFAYSNGRGPDRSLIVFHNRFGDAAGWIREAVPFAEKRDDGSKATRTDTLAAALGLAGPDDGWLRLRDRRADRETLRSVGELRSRGLGVELGAYQCLVLDDLRELASTADWPWADVAARIDGRWVQSLDAEMDALRAERREPDIDPTGEPERDATLTLADGRRIAVAEWGPADGEPVLLLHGMPASRRNCPDRRTTHARGVRLIAFDRPGYGGSDPQPGRTILAGGRDIAEIARLLGLERYAAVGWSSGGPYALAAAVADPERVRAVAVVASDAPTGDYPELLDELPAHIRDRIRRVQAGDPTGVSELRERIAVFVADPDRLMSGATDPDDADDPDARLRRVPAQAASLRAMFEGGFAQGDEGWTEDWLATYADWGFRLADVPGPVAVWRGDRDRLSAEADTLILARDIPGATLHVVPGAGHSLPMIAWSEILDSVLTD
ncbi:MAG TPA: alpha/beta fold hydrolase [Candidatus Limnocylindrales bacterium]|nr:alpha/beta fold hydrolase [Candidatus Limnocylindrales bacterium]